ITLDLRRQAGPGVAPTPIARRDLLLENFRPGTLERGGLGPEALHALNPGRGGVRGAGYGQPGADRGPPDLRGAGAGAGRPGAAPVGGLRALTGYPGMPPVRVGISLADSVAGLYAALGALMALLRRERVPDAGGEVVDVALYEGIYSLMESLVPDFDAFGTVR